VLGLSREAEASLIEPLSRAALPVHPIRIRLGTAEQSAAEVAFIRGAPVSFTRAILDEPLEGLVLAGNLQTDVADELTNWRELSEILDYARGFVPSTLGLGAGGLALARALELDVVPLDRPLHGLVPQRSLGHEHSLLSGSSEVFFSSESRRFGVTDESMDRAVRAGRVTPLAHSRESGVSIFESTDRRFVAHLGRPERDPVRAEVESRPSAFFDSARESARAHAAAFFAAWVRRVYESGRGNRAAVSALAR
jgi:homoserine O-succinyltransferase